MPRTETGSRRTPGLEYVLVLAVGVAAAAVALLALGRPWVETSVVTAGMPSQQQSVTGSEAVPWLRAVALVGLAGVAALLATSGWGRRVVGLVLLAAGAMLALGSGTAGAELLADVASAARSTAAGADSAAVEAAVAGADGSGWRWTSTGAGLLLLAVGVAAALRGPRWPGLGRRHRAPSVATGAAAEPPVTAGPDVDDHADLWREQDHGHDPTR